MAKWRIRLLEEFAAYDSLPRKACGIRSSWTDGL